MSGNDTSYLVLQNVLMSSAVPGSCPAKSLQGKPTTVKPFALNFLWVASRAEYCGVRPHLEATLTTSTTLPL